MKTIFGKNTSLKNSILGRITLVRSVLYRSESILVTDQIKWHDFGYKGIILLSNIQNKRAVCNVEQSLKESFHEGDVVYMEVNGKITFWYEHNSDDNVIVTTENCNHRCVMCPQPIAKDIPNRHKLNLQLVSLMSPNTSRVCITGGEPSLIGNKLIELVRAAKKRMPHTPIDILSNGTGFANRNLALGLSLCMHHDLQIDIPLFSDIPELHHKIVGASTFYKTIEGIQNLALYNMRIGIRVVVHKQTYKRLPQLAEYIYRNFPFVAQVAFMGMEITAEAAENIDELWIDPHDYINKLEEAVNVLENRGLRTYIYNEQLCVLNPSIRKYAVRSISSWKNIYIKECDGCLLKDKCCGFFESNRKWHSKFVHAIIEDNHYSLNRKRGKLQVRSSEQ